MLRARAHLTGPDLPGAFLIHRAQKEGSQLLTKLKNEILVKMERDCKSVFICGRGKRILNKRNYPQPGGGDAPHTGKTKKKIKSLKNRTNRC